MSNAIVTTTINPPTEAIMGFVETGWDMIIVGDMKTPHDKYKQLHFEYPHVTYLNPAKQDRLFHRLSDNIGWNCIQRRAIGIAYAYLKNYDVVSLVDDDNIPTVGWGKNLHIGEKMTVRTFNTKERVFDPLYSLGYQNLWHRGFLIQLLDKRGEVTEGETEMTVHVQADLWDGAPDIDAICRVGNPDGVKFFVDKPFNSNALCPFNSQNTSISHEALKHYYLLPHIGRMDDIWGSYILQQYVPNSVIYSPPSVFQKRNKHDIVKDIKDEMYGYEHTIELVNDLYYWTKYLPEKTQEFVKLYTEAIS